MRKMLLAFTPSVSEDVVSYLMEVIPAGEAEPVVVESVKLAQLQEIEQAPGQKVIDVSSFPAVTDLDGVYDINLYAVDDAGNQSEAGTVAGVEIDFLAPSAPTNLSIMRL